MVATPVGGFLGRRVNARTIAVVGSATATSGLLLALLVLNEDTPYALIAVCLILVAVGSGVFTTGNTSAVLSVVPDGRLDVVNGLRMTLLNVGNVMGAALCLMLASSALAADDRRLLYGGAAAGLSPGAYRLDGAVSLREPGANRAVDLAGMAEGLLVQVLPG